MSDSSDIGRDRPVLIVAGEASSDLHAARLLAELQHLLPGVRAFGMGGSALRKSGCETIVDSETHGSLMGVTELFGSIRKIFAAFSMLVERSRKDKPELAVLVDYPDFNLRLAKRLHAMGVPVLYFITPQLWAWRSGRVHQMKRWVRKAAPIFPFEEGFFHQHGVDAEYVGHPLVETVPEPSRVSAVVKQEGLDETQPILALLPGSRTSELSLLLPIMRDAALRIERGRPGLQIVIPAAPGVDPVELRRRYNLPSHWRVTKGGAREIMAAADVACLASGTATVEAALATVPMVVIYRFSTITYLLAKLLVRGVKSFAMPNLILGEKVVPEILQGEVTVERVAAELEQLLGDPARALAMRMKLGTIRERLTSSTGSAAGRAAQIARDILLESPKKRKV